MTSAKWEELVCAIAAKTKTYLLNWDLGPFASPANQRLDSFDVPLSLEIREDPSLEGLYPLDSEESEILDRESSTATVNPAFPLNALNIKTAMIQARIVRSFLSSIRNLRPAEPTRSATELQTEMATKVNQFNQQMAKRIDYACGCATGMIQGLPEAQRGQAGHAFDTGNTIIRVLINLFRAQIEAIIARADESSDKIFLSLDSMENKFSETLDYFVVPEIRKIAFVV